LKKGIKQKLGFGSGLYSRFDFFELLFVVCYLLFFCFVVYCYSLILYLIVIFRIFLFGIFGDLS